MLCSVLLYNMNLIRRSYQTNGNQSAADEPIYPEFNETTQECDGIKWDSFRWVQGRIFDCNEWSLFITEKIPFIPIQSCCKGPKSGWIFLSDTFTISIRRLDQICLRRISSVSVRCYVICDTLLRDMIVTCYGPYQVYLDLNSNI